MEACLKTVSAWGDAIINRILKQILLEISHFSPYLSTLDNDISVLLRFGKIARENLGTGPTVMETCLKTVSARGDAIINRILKQILLEISHVRIYLSTLDTKILLPLRFGKIERKNLGTRPKGMDTFLKTVIAWADTKTECYN